MINSWCSFVNYPNTKIILYKFKILNLNKMAKYK